MIPINLPHHRRIGMSRTRIGSITPPDVCKYFVFDYIIDDIFKDSVSVVEKIGAIGIKVTVME